AAWQAGDAVAGAVVRTGLDELVLAVRAARNAAGLDGPWSAVLNGGVFRGSSEYAAALGERLRDELGVAGPVEVVADPVGAVLAAAVAHAGRPPKGWGRVRML
ncbi:hypothetical protein, partial [Streptomyces sp. SID3343]|uniref:hypothetical protein n=1 Tax=Streptomyces sp. SID3343 TaxID=2690260 RepID=UPI00136A2062